MNKESIINKTKKKFEGELLKIVLNQIRKLFPDCYICNLDGKVIVR